MTFLVVLLCLLSFIYMPHGPNDMNLALRFTAPGENPSYILGTDYFGRDIMSRIIYGSRSVLLVCFLAVAIGSVVGTLLGAIAAIVKGPLSAVIMRSIDGLMAFPGILLAMMMVAAVGKGKEGAIVAISIFMVPPLPDWSIHSFWTARIPCSLKPPRVTALPAAACCVNITCPCCCLGLSPSSPLVSGRLS